MSHDLFSTFTSFDSSISPVLLVRDVAGDYRQVDADEVLQAAQQVLLGRVRGSDVLASPQAVRDFLRVKLGTLEHEVFAVVHLDSQSRVIEYVEMFRGTVSQTSVYPREVVRESMMRNSAALLLVHNHPSGSTQPSRADEMLTQTLKTALALVDVRVLDHLIVAGNDILSMARADVTQGGIAPFFASSVVQGKDCALCLPPGVGLRPPRRAGLAPQDTAEQAVPDRPVHGVDFALGALFTSSQACLRHAGALAARRGLVASLVFLAVVRSFVFPSPSSLIPRP